MRVSLGDGAGHGRSQSPRRLPHLPPRLLLLLLLLPDLRSITMQRLLDSDQEHEARFTESTAGLAVRDTDGHSVTPEWKQAAREAHAVLRATFASQKTKPSVA